MKDPLLQLAHRILVNHSSPETGRSPRDLLPITFYPVSKVLEPVSVNNDGDRSKMVPASSDLNDWLLLVVTGLDWLHGAGLGVRDLSVYHGPPSKVQDKALNLLAGEISQISHQQARTVGMDQKFTPRNVWI